MNQLFNKTQNESQSFRKKQFGIDELSMFMIIFSFVLLLLILILDVSRYWLLLTWLPIGISYTRRLSKNKHKRYKENYTFVKRYYPASTKMKYLIKNIQKLKKHKYFSCTDCAQELRIPKKTDHIKVTCPKCHYSFTKKTFHGHIKFMKRF